MRNRWRSSILTFWVALSVAPAIIAQTPAQTPSGSTPDLSGVWLRRQNIRTFNVQEPPPLAPWAAEIYRANRQGIPDPLASGVDEMDPTIYCLPDGMPRIYLSNYPFEIVPAPGKLFMHFENGGQVRRIYLDGRAMPEAYPPSFMGFATGRWQGDTLVVETSGFTDLRWIDRTGTPHSDALRVVERIRRVAPEALEIDFVFADSEAFTKPWSGKKAFDLQPDWAIMEHNGLCEDRHRYEYSQKSLLGTKDWTSPGEF